MYLIVNLVFLGVWSRNFSRLRHFLIIVCFNIFKPTLTEQKKKKRNNRPPRIFDFKGKTLMISGLLLYDSHSWDIRVYHAKNSFSFR